MSTSKLCRSQTAMAYYFVLLTIFTPRKPADSFLSCVRGVFVTRVEPVGWEDNEVGERRGGAIGSDGNTVFGRCGLGL